ncbi:MAG: monooxygenase [Gammaproteobacteria bacterium]|nr:MAG: monooxygenase [Gammaproteobacteria bacterium]RLA59578.1 MAG: monooxygenase [Gammaproteobacteria bacterium]
MIVAHVQFPVNVTDKNDFINKMAATTAKYEGLKGLVRKYYMLNESGDRASGLYLWESRADAEAWYNDDWQNYMREAWGEAAQIDYFDCLIVVDNELVKTTVTEAA